MIIIFIIIRCCISKRASPRRLSDALSAFIDSDNDIDSEGESIHHFIVRKWKETVKNSDIYSDSDNITHNHNDNDNDNNVCVLLSLLIFLLLLCDHRHH